MDTVNADNQENKKAHNVYRYIVFAIVFLCIGLFVGVLIGSNIDVTNPKSITKSPIPYPDINNPSDKPVLLPNVSNSGGGVMCTADVMTCPDGSAVGRIPPNCNFAPCDGISDNTVDFDCVDALEAEKTQEWDKYLDCKKRVLPTIKTIDSENIIEGKYIEYESDDFGSPVLCTALSVTRISKNIFNEIEKRMLEGNGVHKIISGKLVVNLDFSSEVKSNPSFDLKDINKIYSIKVSDKKIGGLGVSTCFSMFNIVEIQTEGNN